MQRPLAVLAAAALASIVGLAPALTAFADDAPTPAPTATTEPTPTPSPTFTFPQFPEPPLLPDARFPKTTARWVNGTLTVAYSFASSFHEGGVSDSDTRLWIDGRFVESLAERGRLSDVVEIPRAASAGPALVEVVASDYVERGSFDSTYSKTFFSATVTQQIVRPKKGQVSATALLAGLKVAKERRAGSYAAAKFGHWIDADGDGEDTRTEVLKAESTKKVTKGRDHRVRTGRWVSAYDGTVLRTAAKLDIDHLVPLREAWTSGAAAWSAKKRAAYANDTGYAASLVAVSKPAKRAKGGKEPNAYLPSKAGARCAYVRNYIAVKSRWRLTVDAKEQAALRTDLATYCVNPYVAKPGKPDITALAGKSKPKAAHDGGVASTHLVDPRYGTCTELRRHPNHAPYRRGVDPEYAWYQDRDHDGLVCE